MKILDHVPAFHRKIYSLLKKVPKGKVTTYKALAQAAGTKAYRAVGQAMRCNPYAPIVPCHRVVASDGSIGGFRGTRNSKSKEIALRMLNDPNRLNGHTIFCFIMLNYWFQNNKK